MGEEVESDGGGLFGGEEGSLLQLTGLGEVVHAVEVNPATVLGDQPAVVRVRLRGLLGQPALETLDVEVDRFQ